MSDLKELINRTLVAASTAENSGFKHSAAALLAVAYDLQKARVGYENGFDDGNNITPLVSRRV